MRCPFEIGEKIVCINNGNHLSRGIANLTLNKTYSVVSHTPGKLFDNLCIIDDNGSYGQYMWERFISVKKYRKQKLNKVNEVSF